MTDKTLKQTIDKVNIMAKLIKTDQSPSEVFSNKPKDFDDDYSKAIDIINGGSGERGFSSYFISSW